MSIFGLKCQREELETIREIVLLESSLEFLQIGAKASPDKTFSHLPVSSLIVAVGMWWITVSSNVTNGAGIDTTLLLRVRHTEGQGEVMLFPASTASSCRVKACVVLSLNQRDNIDGHLWCTVRRYLGFMQLFGMNDFRVAHVQGFPHNE